MKKISLTKKLLISYIVLVLAVSVLSVVMVLPGQLQTMNQHLEETLSRVAYILAHDTEIIGALRAGEFPQPLRERLRGISEMTHDTIDYIVVADKNSTRLYHPDRKLIGGKFAGGDELSALSGKAENYVTTQQGHPDIQKRAFNVVRAENGEILGFVMTSTSTKKIEAHKWEMIFRAGGLMTFSLITGLFLAAGITVSVRRILLGYDPTTFARMYLQREEILDKLYESIFVVNTNWRVIYKNLPSKSYIKTETLAESSPLFPYISDCFKSNELIPWSPVELNEKSLLISLVPLRPMESLDAVMVILRDRTEIVKLTEKLTGSNHLVDALRANTHEFRNTLHIIAGFLQLEKIEDAKEYISKEWAKGSGQNILRFIKDKTIAALLIGKANRATEMDIEFELRSDSYLPENNKFLTSNELMLIVGNLIENAYEAIGDSKGARQVEFFINAEPSGLTISVDDTGCGMTEEQAQKILSSAFTTKGAGHGYGMRRIREIVDRHGGYLNIESEVGVGTSITVNISAKSPKNDVDNGEGKY